MLATENLYQEQMADMAVLADLSNEVIETSYLPEFLIGFSRNSVIGY